MFSKRKSMITTLLALLLALILSVACTPSGGSEPAAEEPTAEEPVTEEAETANDDDPLAGTSWQLVEMGPDDNPVAPLPDTSITAEFNDGQITGATGCNSYFADYTVNTDGSLELSEIGSTLIGCPEPLMTQENNFLAAMAAVDTLILAGEELTLIHPNGELLFAARPTEPEAATSGEATDPTVEVRSWEEALEILNSGEVVAVFQTHSLDVTLELADGRMIHTVEPNIDDIFTAVNECGQPCEGIVLATE